MNKKNKWTQEQDNWLKINYNVLGVEKCADFLEKSEAAIYQRVNKTLKIKSEIYWSIEEINYLKNNFSEKSDIELSKILNRKLSSIDSMARKLNLYKSDSRFRNSHRKDFFDEQYFSKIDSFKKAYWLGWLWSDGGIRTKNNTISFNLSKRDSYILEEFKKDIKSNLKIREYQNKNLNYVSFRVTSKKMVEDLLKLNFTNKKTYSQIEPIIPELLVPAFLLGLFDGDGCAYLYNKKYTKIHFTGTYKLCEWIKKYFDNYLKTKSGYLSNTCNSILFGRLDIGKQDNVRKIYNLLYQNAEFFLIRKEKIFRNIIVNPPRIKQSIYNGVSRVKNKFTARIRLNNEKIFLGYFDTEIEAAKSYDKKLLELGGDKSKLNFKYE